MNQTVLYSTEKPMTFIKNDQWLAGLGKKIRVGIIRVQRIFRIVNYSMIL